VMDGHGHSDGPAVVWLDDEPRTGWIVGKKEELASLGLSVDVASGFRRLTQILEHRKEHPERVVAIILDIMIVGVPNLTAFFPWVSDGRTSEGYAAGLVFLERVLSPSERSPRDKLFGLFESVPVIMYSARRLSPEENRRISFIGQWRKAPLIVLVKAEAGELVEKIKSLFADSAES
jgi:hypothetical protein